MIYPFITKAGSLTSFKTVSTSDFQSFGYGDIMSSSYPMSASVSTQIYYPGFEDTLECDKKKRHIRSLRNTLNSYLYLSNEYAYEKYMTDVGYVKMVSIPSIFYGSSIQKGTVELKLYYKGRLYAKLEDTKRNGELRQTYPEVVTKCHEEPHPHLDRVAGVVLYNEGFILLRDAGDWRMGGEFGYIPAPGGWWGTCPSCEVVNDPERAEPYNPVARNPKWTYFGELGNPEDKTCNIAAGVAEDDPSVTLNPDWSWSLSFSGTNYIPTLTMLAHAPKGELNHSNNPTFLEYGQEQNSRVSDTEFIEKDNLEINNTVKAPYNNPEGNFRKQTWISKIGIYDEEKNLIGIVKLATPIRKTEERELTFKLKLDF